MLYSIFRAICKLIFKIVFRIKVFDKKNIPRKGGFIIASNHMSYLDPIALGVVCPRRLNFMARHDLFYNPFFSWLLTKSRAFPVRRNSPDSSALKEAMRRVKGGEGLVLFPEGSRSSSEPQAGIGFLTAKLNVPVIPAFVKGTERALPKGAKLVQSERIFVYFGKQISIERRMPYQDIAGKIMEEIRRLA